MAQGVRPFLRHRLHQLKLLLRSGRLRVSHWRKKLDGSGLIEYVAAEKSRDLTREVTRNTSAAKASEGVTSSPIVRTSCLSAYTARSDQLTDRVLGKHLLRVPADPSEQAAPPPSKFFRDRTPLFRPPTSSETEAMDETDRVAVLERRNQELQHQLSSVQDMLSSSRAERDDMGIKYSALTDRLDRMLKPGEDLLPPYEPASARSASATRAETARASSAGPSVEPVGSRLQEENMAFRRRLATYRDSQKQQAHVVQQLQSKIQQYRQRCADLEERMADSGRRLEASDQQHQDRRQQRDRELNMDLETALVRLEEAENRCVTLSDVNNLLREQLDAAQAANESLTGEVQKLTADWQRLRDELEHKEVDWKEEEQTFNQYYNAEHARMLKLWKEIVGFRRDFSELKLGTERDLTRVRSEMSRLARQTTDACTSAASSENGGNTPIQAETAATTAASRSKGVSQMSAAFKNASMWDKMQDIQKQETTFRVKKRELDTKIKDLSNQVDIARSEIVEKDKIVTSLNKMVHTLEVNSAELGQKLDHQRHVGEENDVLTQAIRQVAQLVVDDAERSGAGPEVSVLVKSTALSSADLELVHPVPDPVELVSRTTSLSRYAHPVPDPVELVSRTTSLSSGCLEPVHPEPVRISASTSLCEADLSPLPVEVTPTASASTSLCEADFALLPVEAVPNLSASTSLNELDLAPLASAVVRVSAFTSVDEMDLEPLAARLSVSTSLDEGNLEPLKELASAATSIDEANLESLKQAHLDHTQSGDRTRESEEVKGPDGETPGLTSPAEFSSPGAQSHTQGISTPSGYQTPPSPFPWETATPPSTAPTPPFEVNGPKAPFIFPYLPTPGRTASKPGFFYPSDGGPEWAARRTAPKETKEEASAKVEENEAAEKKDVSGTVAVDETGQEEKKEIGTSPQMPDKAVSVSTSLLSSQLVPVKVMVDSSTSPPAESEPPAKKSCCVVT